MYQNYYYNNSGVCIIVYAIYTYKAKISILYTSFASAWNPRYQCAYNIPLTKKTQKQWQKLGSSACLQSILRPRSSIWVISWPFKYRRFVDYNKLLSALLLGIGN